MIKLLLLIGGAISQHATADAATQKHAIVLAIRPGICESIFTKTQLFTAQ
jgi:hypothetical protein